MTTAASSNLQGSLRGRLGYAWGRLLPFVTGGAALAGFSQQSYLWGEDRLGLFNASSSHSSVRAGWTLGAGAEWAMTRSWAVRGEYRYTAFGSLNDASTYAAPVATAFTGTRRLDQNQVEFGVSYKFGEEGRAPLVVAADLPHLKDALVEVLPLPNSPWRGFYAGVNLGGLWDAKSGQAATAAYYDPKRPFGAPVGVNPNLAYLPGGANGAAGGALGGGQVGYNYQLGAVLLGAEADIATTSVTGGGKQNAALYASPFTAGSVLARKRRRLTRRRRAYRMSARCAVAPAISSRRRCFCTPRRASPTTASTPGASPTRAPAGRWAAARSGCSPRAGPRSSNISSQMLRRRCVGRLEHEQQRELPPADQHPARRRQLSLQRLRAGSRRREILTCSHWGAGGRRACPANDLGGVIARMREERDAARLPLDPSLRRARHGFLPRRRGIDRQPSGFSRRSLGAPQSEPHCVKAFGRCAEA